MSWKVRVAGSADYRWCGGSTLHVFMVPSHAQEPCAGGCAAYFYNQPSVEEEERTLLESSELAVEGHQ